jgi:hypothetical protein
VTSPERGIVGPWQCLAVVWDPRYELVTTNPCSYHSCNRRSSMRRSKLKGLPDLGLNNISKSQALNEFLTQFSSSAELHIAPLSSDLPVLLRKAEAMTRGQMMGTALFIPQCSWSFPQCWEILHFVQHMDGSTSATKPACCSWYGLLSAIVRSVYRTNPRLPYTRACLVSSLFDSPLNPSRALASTQKRPPTGSSWMNQCPLDTFFQGRQDP